jgi:uncharacterized membrane protein
VQRGFCGVGETGFSSWNFLSKKEKYMSIITKSIDVDVPVQTAYHQWTQFEEFPKFMEGITEVTQLDDERLHWKANIAGEETEWFAKVTEQIPETCIAWISRGAMNAGAVTFQPLSNAKSKVMLQLEYNPYGFMEQIGDATRLVTDRVEGDLKRFKDYIEVRGL